MGGGRWEVGKSCGDEVSGLVFGGKEVVMVRILCV